MDAGGAAGVAAGATPGGGSGSASLASGASNGGASLAGGGSGGASLAGDGGAPSAPIGCELGIGPLKNVYVPKPSADGTAWYINDHTIVRGPDNLWHMIGITHEEPRDPLHETILAHATSPTLTAGNWTQQAPALTADPAFGETELWAPYVIKDRDTFYVFYCGGGKSEAVYQIEVATSKDLFTWTRNPTPLFVDGYQARDPFVLREGDKWVLYYTATTDPGGGNHVVKYRTSTDLLNWSDAKTAYQDSQMGNVGGPTESPFVVQRNSTYYLFVGPRTDYSSTGVFTSTDPVHFDQSQAYPVGQAPSIFPTHAAEIIVDLDGKYYMTHAGWAQGGLWIAALSWPTCP